MNEDKKYEIIKFIDEDFSLDVKISPYDKTIWLTQNDMASLFDVDKSRISRHIKNILTEGELNDSVCAETATTGSDEKKYKSKIYNLDMVLIVGYRIKSKRITKFREWALSEIDKLNNINKQKALISQYILFNYDEIKLNVNVDPNEDTVWLTQNDMAILFDTTKQNISMHIKNISNDDELDNSVVKDFFTTAQDGKNYQTKMYNLDMIIAIGYRVNTKRGTIFRKWATKILKQYLLKGYVIDEERCLNCTSNILSLQEQYAEINTKIKKIENTIYPEDTKLFYEGEILDAYIFIIRLFFLAKKEIIIIDPYADIFIF
nr:virulence RhuM family protein [Acholeplasmatales bacterium]